MVGYPCLLEKNDELIFEEFLKKTGKTNMLVLAYHYPFYRDIMVEMNLGVPYYIGYKNATDELIAVLPGFVKTANIGSVYSSLPFFGPNGGVLIDENEIDTQTIYKCIFDFLFSILEKKDIISYSFYSKFGNNSDYANLDNLLKDSLIVEKQTNFLNLDTFKLSTSIEYDIRKAKKQNIVIRDIESQLELDEVMSIYEKNCVDYGIPVKPKVCLIELLKYSKTTKNVGFYVAELDNKIIGGLIVLYSESVVSYFLPCSIHEFRSFQPMTLLINYAINIANEKGIKYWNWESSPSIESGVYKFKKKWGGDDLGYRIYVLPKKDNDYFKEIGVSLLSEIFPYYFVYPFNLLKND